MPGKKKQTINVPDSAGWWTGLDASLAASSATAPVSTGTTLSQEQAAINAYKTYALKVEKDLNEYLRRRAMEEPPEVKEEDMPPMVAKEGFTFGCDPELFVKNEKGVYVSAAGIFPGTKDQPYKVKDGWVQVDGMAFEFNIEPVDNYKDWNAKIASVIKQGEEMLPEGWSFDAVPFVRFDPEIFDHAPDEAKELGCSPDCDAWTGDTNIPPSTEDDPYLRTASGHIHIGWEEEPADLTDPQHLMNCRDLVKQLDWYLGAWSIKFDPDPTRRKLYGKAGACRYKTYGVEYRVLSNFWVMSPQRRLTVWNRMMSAIAAIANDFIPDNLPPPYMSILRDSINKSKLAPDLTRNCKFPILTLNQHERRF